MYKERDCVKKSYFPRPLCVFTYVLYRWRPPATIAKVAAWSDYHRPKGPFMVPVAPVRYSFPVMDVSTKRVMCILLVC